MVTGEGTACDVGTDHAYLPVYLINQNICKNVIAADIADGPLKAAAATVENNNMKDRISVVKSDGLKNISPKGISDVIMAGMGAETISGIIEAAPWLKNDVNIIIQPMTKIPFLRKWLYQNGYEIIREEAVSDAEFIYTVMKVRYSGMSIRINETAANTGVFDYGDQTACEFVKRQAEKIVKIIEGMKKSEKSINETGELEMALENMEALASGEVKYTVGDVYREINRVAGFGIQDSWDNSGLLVGDRSCCVKKVLCTLDITNDVIEEAHEKGCELIVSHHPVIFHPLKKISFNEPAGLLLKYGIAAICVHTPLDMARDGINDILVNMMKEELSLNEKTVPLEPLRRDVTIGTGRICHTEKAVLAGEMAEKLKKIFGCTVVRYFGGTKEIKKIAVCSGSGGSLLGEVIDAGCDAYVTGDVKHDVWIDAANNDISLFDCGHFYTEKPAVYYLKNVIDVNLPGIEVGVSERNVDVVRYL